MTIKAKKKNMTQIWKDNKVLPVTIVEVRDDSDISHIKPDSEVTISGRSKGKGFQGVVKRYGMSKQPKTHGQKHTLRAPGSAGPTDPQRIFPGKKMPGRTGGDRVTIKNVLVAQVDKDTNKVFLKGGVPGSKGSEIEIRIDNKE